MDIYTFFRWVVTMGLISVPTCPDFFSVLELSNPDGSELRLPGPGIFWNRNHRRPSSASMTAPVMLAQFMFRIAHVGWQHHSVSGVRC